MFNASYIELSESALRNNLKFIRHQIGKNTRYCSVIKGNAYGHGIKQFTPLLENAGVDYFAVYSANEAWQAKNVLSDDSRLMIMGMVEDEALEWTIKKGVEFYVFDTDRLNKAINIARKVGRKARIHLELETGMNRTGFDDKDLGQAMDMIRLSAKEVSIRGICTHFAGAESITNYIRVKKQFLQFKRISRYLVNDQQTKNALLHAACSAGVIAYPKSILDMVRVGILQYGFWPNEETKTRYLISADRDKNPLKRVISWKSRVMVIKNIKKGEFVGYGTSYMANSDMKIAVVPIGYAHGYSRALSNYGRVLIRGKRLSVIGIVNMNAITVNITDLPVVEKGDEVVIIGRQGKNSISVASFGEFSNQLNYELLTRLPSDIPRIVIV